jgi:transcription termination factor NusB
LAEIFYLDEEIPIIVSINEAVDLAKKFWDNSSKSIVNWVLNNVLLNYDKLEKEKEKHNEKKYSIFTKGI